MLKVKAKYNDGLASRYQAAQTRLRKFEQAGPPEGVPVEQNVAMAMEVATRAYVLEEGRIAAEGTPDELLARPEIKKAYLGV